MSGTSVDGIDAAMVRVRGTVPRVQVELLGHHAVAWPPRLRARLLAVMAPARVTTEEICALNVAVAERFADAARAAAAAAGVALDAVAALASHGQTVCHLPPATGRTRRARDDPPATLQLGDPSVIATLTGITTVGNFRPADLARGGQGAPLVPFADALLLRHPRVARCVQNIGGIANVTYLPAGRHARDRSAGVVAFDTGPGNMLLDALTALATHGRERFDRDGRHAAAGTLDYPLFRRLQAHPFFHQAPPKSTGREAFGGTLARAIRAEARRRRLTLDTMLHTVTFLTAWSIVDAYVSYLPELPAEVIVCGGGADNPVLMALLQSQLAQLQTPAPIAVRRIDAYGIANKAKEALSFALLAAATLDGVAANVPGATGAAGPAILGVIAPGARRR